jgi:alkylation response protein AidB-like acyl-CoA dehydrogenase
MSLGLIEECLKLSVQYAKDRMLWGKPIGDRQLIQLKLAKMEVARLNVQNLVFRHIELSAAGKSLTLAEASAMKLYSAQAASDVAMEAVQLFGGNGYMAEFRWSNSPVMPRCSRSMPAPTRSRSPTSPRTCSTGRWRRRPVPEPAPITASRHGRASMHRPPVAQ